MSLARFFAIATCVAVLPGATCDGAPAYGARASGPPVAGRLARPDLATFGPWGDRVPPIFASRRPEAGATLRRDHSSGQAGGRDGRAPKRNRLANESSAYLLQHATNPIDWYPWGDEAFRVAKKENKPVFLSIGYLTCHWCQVMEEESFSDPAVAKILNESFVAIKVDREERPDVDATYMAAARLLVENAGWPLNVILTPDGDAFFATTYVPREDRDGRTGLVTILSRLAEAWRERREQIVSSADLIAEALGSAPPAAGALDEALLQRGFRELAERFDDEHGGFLPAPKFLAPNELRFLLRYGYRTGEPEALRMVDQTLRAMRRAPIHDAIGFGFHRYASDAAWSEPHFEKMLYDQALMAIVATEAFQATGRAEHRRTAAETLDGMLAAFRSPSGAFHAALDARSGGREGAFYRWSAAELAAAAGDEADLARAVFRRGADGTLALAFDEEAVAKRFDLKPERLAKRIDTLRRRLVVARNRRPPPAVDRKILADWNGLAIAALAKGASALDEPRHARRAREAAEAVLHDLRAEDGTLLHAGGSASRPVAALAADYAFLGWGLLELYEATGEARWLAEAMRIEREAEKTLRDAAARAEPGDAPRLPEHLVVTDTGVPSAASIRISNQLRIGRMTGDDPWNESARAMLDSVSAALPPNASLASSLLAAAELALSPSVEVVLGGDPSSEAMLRLRRATFETFVPHKVVLHHSGESNDPIEKLAPFTELYGKAVSGRALAFVCVDQVCHLPTADPQRLREQLRDLPRGGGVSPPAAPASGLPLESGPFEDEHRVPVPECEPGGVVSQPDSVRTIEARGIP